MADKDKAPAKAGAFLVNPVYECNPIIIVNTECLIS